MIVEQTDYSCTLKAPSKGAAPRGGFDLDKAQQLELRKLIADAFADAKAKGKQHWQVMHLSVLKNRLLQRTKRQFQETSYGANTMLEIVSLFPDLLALRNEQPPSVIFLIEELEEGPRDQTTTSSNDLHVRDSLDDREGFQSILDEYRKSGDNLSVGEAYAAQFQSDDEADVEEIFAKVVSSWASAEALDVAVTGIADLVRNVDRFVDDHLARAVVHATLRMEEAQRESPPNIVDIYYRVMEPLKSMLPSLERTSPRAAVRAATVRTKELRSSLDGSVASFCRSTAASAKIPSTDVIRHAHAYAPYALPSERQTLRDVEILLGPLFRKFCESCENHEADRIPRRAKDLRYQLQRTLDSLRIDSSHRLKKTVLEPIATHISRLLEEGTRTSEEMTTPSIQIANNTIKLDLDRQEGHVDFPLRIINDGDGPARSVRAGPPKSPGSPTLSVLEPSEPFDVLPKADRLIVVRLSDIPGTKEVTLDAVFKCETVNGRTLVTSQHLTFVQQHAQPDWENLLRDPPYRVNPIRQKSDLYGRRSILGELELHVSNETSVFLWGQKRIGKTSVLQVLANDLEGRPDVVCVVLRMGELASLHEGQIAHTIATRLARALVRQAPTEEEFGAGLGRLIPVVDHLRATAGKKLLVIVDEFDDLNPAFYLGERGKQFVKALRSLSEVGLTFMFVGSERMGAIYAGHSADLNKWVSSSLDRIESEADCEALIVQPVLGMIEYDREAVSRIVEYCQGNPFYMHLVAGRIFQRCAEERRTFVGSSDFEHVHLKFVQELGPTNFAHFWEDVPELKHNKKLRVVANNCLFLACVARLGSGGYEALEDLILAQNDLRLTPSERLLLQDAREVEAGLLQRRVMSRRTVGDSSHMYVKLPIFRDWLLGRGEVELMHRRRMCLDELDIERQIGQPVPPRAVDHAAFPVDEDALLSVSERLVFLGRHKDVAEVRQWLRQFDDDGRIEIAFLLLERLVDRGFVSEGMSTNGLEKMQRTINARRQDVGNGAWRMVRRRRDNLYIGYVDAETKSGATTARELGIRMSPGKCGGIDGMHTWLRGHLDEDPVLVVVDDFAGTGATLVKGLRKLWLQDEGLFTKAAKEGRILCCLQTVLPDAIDRIEREFPDVVVLPMKTFGDDVRAFAAESGIFENEDERAFAEEVMLQIGRQLVPQNPLGFGDTAALVSFHNTVPNNTLPVFWCHGVVNNREWKPLIPRRNFQP